MIASFDMDYNNVKIIINDAKIDGQNSVFEFIVEQKIALKTVEKIIIDFDKVSYINSLGIAEFVALMKYYTEKKPKMKYRFINVDKKISKIFKMVELASIADIESK